MSAAVVLSRYAERTTIARMVRPLFAMKPAPDQVRESLTFAVEEAEGVLSFLRSNDEAYRRGMTAASEARDRVHLESQLRIFSDLRAFGIRHIAQVNGLTVDETLQPLWQRYIQAHNGICVLAGTLAGLAGKLLGISHRYPTELDPEHEAQLSRSVPVDFEAYLRWLETGEGSDPCGEPRT
jgi:hypothetical protein